MGWGCRVPPLCGLVGMADNEAMAVASKVELEQEEERRKAGAEPRTARGEERKIERE